MLAGKGFDTVYNLSGGLKAWNGEAAVGDPDLGLELFTGKESVDQALVVAYGLEQGLRDFYLQMTDKVRETDARDLFKKLSQIEVKHQDHIFDVYRRQTGRDVDRRAFESEIVSPALEGGLSTEAYVDRLQPDWEAVNDILAVALSIEAQALDLYLRAAERSRDAAGREALLQIAAEERAHMAALGELMQAA